MNVYRAALISWGALFTIGCSSGTGSTPTAAPRGVLTSEMLRETQESDLFAAIQRLRPQWLRARGAARVSGGNLTVAVFVNDVRRGEVDVLRTFRLEGVERVQFFTGSEATTRWGTGVAGGVILVTLSRR
jgi:hypothetical protein